MRVRIGIAASSDRMERLGRRRPPSQPDRSKMVGIRFLANRVCGVPERAEPAQASRNGPQPLGPSPRRSLGATASAVGNGSGLLQLLDGLLRIQPGLEL